MIRLLLIAFVFLFILWLIIELFSKDSNKKLKLKFKPSYLILILLIVSLPFILKFLPKIISSAGGLNSVVSPIIGIIKNLIPFI